MADVLITYDQLTELDQQLQSIVAELQAVQNRTDEVQNAIGTPYGRGELRDRAGTFESGWDDRRKKLIEDLTAVEKQVRGVVQGFGQWDAQTTQQLSGGSGGSSGGNGTR